MKIERKNNELLISIPDNILDVKEIQDLLDYLRYRTITSKSKAKDEDITEIAEEIDKSWWEQNKSRFII